MCPVRSCRCCHSIALTYASQPSVARSRTRRRPSKPPSVALYTLHRPWEPTNTLSTRACGTLPISYAKTPRRSTIFAMIQKQAQVSATKVTFCQHDPENNDEETQRMKRERRSGPKSHPFIHTNHTATKRCRYPRHDNATTDVDFSYSLWLSTSPLASRREGTAHFEEEYRVE